MRAVWLGRVAYRDGLQLQYEIAAARASGVVGDTLLLLEHPPTITAGRAASRDHVLASPSVLEERGVELVDTDRGGDVTYHGPGQLVAYPIVSLDAHGRDLHAYLRALEQAVIEALAELGIEAGRLPPHTGVWVGRLKIAAIGIKVRRWVTMHGCSLNVGPDLSGFEMIVPCGIRDKGVTSISRQLGRPLEVAEVAGCVARHLIARLDGGSPCDEDSWGGLTDDTRRILATGIDPLHAPVLNSQSVWPEAPCTQPDPV